MRTTEAKQYVSEKSASISSNMNTSAVSSSYAAYTGKTTASGAPDMRTAAAKAYVASQSSYPSNTPSYSSASGS
jgi:hypothetical protein